MGSLPIALSMYRGDIHGFIAYSSLYVQGGRPWVLTEVLIPDSMLTPLQCYVTVADIKH